MSLVGQRCQDLRVSCESGVGVCKCITWAPPPSTPGSVWSGFSASPHPGSVSADRCRAGRTDRGSLLGLLKAPPSRPQEAGEKEEGSGLGIPLRETSDGALHVPVTLCSSPERESHLLEGKHVR